MDYGGNNTLYTHCSNALIYVCQYLFYKIKICFDAVLLFFGS